MKSEVKMYIITCQQELFLKETLMADPLMIRDLWKNSQNEMIVKVKRIQSSRPKPKRVVECKREHPEYNTDNFDEYEEEYESSNSLSELEARLAATEMAQKTRD